MNPDDTYPGISVYYGVATCEGCGAEESFDGEMVDGRYVATPAEVERYATWRDKHAQHPRGPQ